MEAGRIKKRKRIPPTSDSDHQNNKNEQNNQNNQNSNKKKQIPATTTDENNKQLHTRSPSDSSSSSSNHPILNQHPQPSATDNINQDEELKQKLKNNFKFLILDGPGFYSNYQALKKMIESAQTCLEEEPDEAIYQTELDEKSAQLRAAELSFDDVLNTAASPVIEGLTHFIQAQVDRQLKIRLDQAIQAHSAHQEKKFEKNLKTLQHSHSQTEIKQLEKKFKEIENNHKTRLDHLQTKLASLEANLNKQAPQLSSTEGNSNETENNHKNHTDSRAPPGNALKLALSPQTSTAQSQPSIRHRSSSQSQSKSTHPDPNPTPVNPATRNSTGNTSQQRPNPLKIPVRVSVDAGGASPRPATAPADHSSLPSDSPVNTTNSAHHSTAPPPTAEALYEYISKRLMASKWLLDYSKVKLTDFYKQQIPQDLTNHLDQLGLTSQRISELLSFLSILPDLDLKFLSKKVATIATPTTPGNNPIVHLYPQQQPGPILNPNNALHLNPPTNIPVPSNFHLVENFSLTYLKDILGKIQFDANHLLIRLNRFEIRLGNAEKLGIDDHGAINALIKRMDFAETQTLPLVTSRATSENLHALETLVESKITAAQRETKDSVKALRDETTSAIKSLSRPSKPHTSPAGQSAHQGCLSMFKVENYILDRLFNEFERLSSRASSNTTKSKSKQRDRSEFEEGETSGEEDECKETVESILTDGRTNYSQTSGGNRVSIAGDPSARWKALGEMVYSQYQAQLQKEKDALVYNHQHQHHYHHHHHHRVRMLLGLDKNSEEDGAINCLKLGKQIDHQELNQAAELLVTEKRREEILAETSVSQSTAPSASSAAPDIPVHPQVNPASTSA
ncbi:hypothetical protein PGT21_002309 [Puccinia graminis f. sp. tritici]|uniref:Uncharacterized protein n=1 Tax=Puccinia graminis f. sp. tritici TaxID=56615 RepID=A0A5B0QMB9_PUCGR|nr:hypothetical protein PGT21_002309 [Puccinia graminis f. sp. tritici]